MQHQKTRINNTHRLLTRINNACYNKDRKEDKRLGKQRTTRQVIATLKKAGFVHVRQTGSHATYEHLDGRKCTVPVHSQGTVLAKGTLKSIENQSGVSF